MGLDASIFDEADLNAFTDGRLEPSRAAALAESLTADRHGRARIDAWKRQNDGLKTLFASVLFEPVPVRLMPTTLATTAVPASAAKPSEGSAPGSGGILAVMALGVALVGFVAGALATIATDGFGRGFAAQRGTDGRSAVSLQARAAENYAAMLADVIRPGEFSAADKARLRRWMTEQLPDGSSIPDLRTLGWGLLGGRIVGGQYAPAVFLTYGNGADHLGLYVARAPSPIPPADADASDGAVSTTAWSQNETGYALVVSRDARRTSHDVAALRDAIRRQIGDDAAMP